MGKFALACPRCDHYVQAYGGIAGLFVKTVKCACGNRINVKEERRIAVVCGRCQNGVVIDVGKSNPQCPVCGVSLKRRISLRGTTS